MIDLRRATSLVLICALLFLALPLPALAAEVEGDLLVEVLTEEENPIEGAVVRVRDQEARRSALEETTGPDGTVRFKNLPIGNYTVEIEHAEFGRDRALVRVNAGVDNVFTGLLTPEGVEEVLVIQEDLLHVNTQDPTAGSTTRRDADFIDRQVTNSGSLQAVVSTVPGIQTNSLGQVHARGEHKSLTVSLDGIDLPVPLETSITQPIDPEFLEQLEVSTGNYDASQGGQLGVVLNAATFTGSKEPYAEVVARAGDKGQAEMLVRAAGTNEDETFSYFVGAKYSQSDLYLEPPHPDQQTLNNTGRSTNVLVRLKHHGEADEVGLTLSHVDNQIEIPQTPQNFAAGVRLDQDDQNSLALVSWKHELDEDSDLLLGLAYQRSRQRINNNGVFTPYFTVPEALNEELAEEGFPLDPEQPGSPYLPMTDLEVEQIQPSLEFTRRFGELHRVKAGLSANFINSRQSVDIIDAGGGGLLPNPTDFPGNVTRFRANIDRDGFIGGVYLSHTLPLSDEVILNYGVRADTFDNGLGVSTGQISPRVNLTFAPSETQALRLSYNRLFQPPPLELDVSGQTEVLPQRTHAYEISYENQFAKNAVARLAYVYKDFRDQIDVGLLIANSNVPVFAPINFARAYYSGVELSVNTFHETGWNGFLAATIGTSKPTEPGLFAGHFPEFNDHDQRVQVTGGLSHTWENGLTAGLDFLYGSGYPQEAIPLYNQVGIAPFGLAGDRFDRFITNLNLQWVNESEQGPDYGVGLQVLNLFDDRSVLNFLSEFSGTRFVQGRRFLFKAQVRF